MKPGFEWIGLIGVNLISIFVVFACCTGWYGPYRAKPDYDFKGAGVRNSGESPGRFQRKHHQEAPADQLHRNSDCYDHASDSVIHLHGELLKLPGTGSNAPCRLWAALPARP